MGCAAQHQESSTTTKSAIHINVYKGFLAATMFPLHMAISIFSVTQIKKVDSFTTSLKTIVFYDLSLIFVALFKKQLLQLEKYYSSI